VEFGMYTDEEVRERSIIEIKSTMTFDSLGNPLPRGLYDPRLGPTESTSSCVTCGNQYRYCGGHCGHLELCVPVYHPLTFMKLVALLRLKCLNCHRFRVSAMQTSVFETKLHLINNGYIKDALELDAEIYTAMKSTEQKGASNRTSRKSFSAMLKDSIKAEEDDGEAAEDGGIGGGGESSATERLLAQKMRLGPKYGPGFRLTSHEREVKRLLIKEYSSACMTQKKCGNCMAFSPKIRQDAYNKIFQSPMAPRNARINAAERIKIRPASEVPNPEANEGWGDLSDDSDPEDEDNLNLRDDDDKPNSNANDQYLHGIEVEAQARLTWEREPTMCAHMFGKAHVKDGDSGLGHSIFFLHALCVPPSRFRPPMFAGGMQVEHSQNTYLTRVLILNEQIRNLDASIRDSKAGKVGADVKPPLDGGEIDLTAIVQKQSGAFFSRWIDLQTTVNCYMDSSRDPKGLAGNAPNGIRQLLERKEGLFRKHMMGKRVDFACRSVISPDPYIGGNEIGIPVAFAKKLTYPTPVTELNVAECRDLVERGPNEYPGAVWVEETLTGKRFDLHKMQPSKRLALAAGLLSKNSNYYKIGRQLRTGDMILMNRQPTLHKPGIMAHSVRVLHSPTQQTIRMHYANCNTYNADFDGDEMNGHFPQSDIGRAEAKFLAATDLQYLAPTDGAPLRGLIQDHVDAGVKMTNKDTFLKKWEYQQLLFSSLASLPGLEVVASDMEIEMVPPAIRKPVELWTGKQLISSLLHNLRRGNDRDLKRELLPGISMERKSKMSAAGFGESMEEHLVIVRDGELVRGILDKGAFGSSDFSLVHAVYEAYGPDKAGLLLNSLGRLFTAYLQYYACHSCRMEDLILTAAADSQRRELVKEAYNKGSRAAKAWADSDGGKVELRKWADDTDCKLPLKPVEIAATAAKIGELLSGKEGPDNFASLDAYMQSQMNPLASDVIKACLPNGLNVPFPSNTFSLMVTTGAKGSTVNQSQISCLLGQQALEGRRVPRMSSGRTLPSFQPYDPMPRADGYVADRFLTGIRPQEYYFHCMAGREGLVDTAVKTSRSGYLQRCLVKHLEELKVSYDGTVRDGEGGVVQFLYGEDGIDPIKAAYLGNSSSNLQFLARNYAALKKRYTALPHCSIDLAASDAEKIEEMKESSIVFNVGSFVRARKLRIGSRWKRGALCRGWFDAIITKTYDDDKHYDIEYVKDKTNALHMPRVITLLGCGSRITPAETGLCTLIEPSVPDPILFDCEREGGGHRVGSSGLCVSEKVARDVTLAMSNDKRLISTLNNVGLSSDDFRNLIAAKYGSALVNPGEAVGSIAAQSIGEPSTQMTLNTFHLAGSGANVTLGIPRLREIIMSAAKTLKTPTMSVPINPSMSDREASRLVNDFTKLTIMDLIANKGGIVVTESIQQSGGGFWERCYQVTLKLHPAERIWEAFSLTIEDVARVVTRSYIPKLAYIMKMELKKSNSGGDVAASNVQGGGASEFMENDGTMDPEVDKVRKPQKKDSEYDDELTGEEDGVSGSRFGHRKEMVSYGDMDEEDKVIATEIGDTGEFDCEYEDDNGIHTVTDDEDDAAGFVSANKVKLNKKKNTIIVQPLRVDPATQPLLMVGLAERAANQVLVRSRSGIERAFMNEEPERGRCLQTAGLNFEEIWKLDNVDHNKLLSNDTWAFRCSYGVEAARMNIGNQISSVFAVYGIEVDPRHLSLIADYMTFDGDYKPMSRIGMRSSSSTFLQMSFETTANFLVESALSKNTDALMSPSANIVLGRPVRHGTGAFECFVAS